MKSSLFISTLIISSIFLTACSSEPTEKIPQADETVEIQGQNSDTLQETATQDTDEITESQSKEENTERGKNTQEAVETQTPEYLEIIRDGSNLVFENVLAENTFYTRYRISYQSEGLSISGIMNIPKGEGDFPLLILNHGYIDPAIYTLGRGLKREQDYFARNGFAVLHTDYRNHAFSDTDESLSGTGTILRSKKYGSDSINAILAVQNAKNNGDSKLDSVNSENVGMLGHSMGGGVTMYSLVAASDLIEAAVLYAPVHSNEFYNYERWSSNRLSESEKEMLQSDIGNLGNPENFLAISPENYFENIQAPIQMYFGTNDASCPIEWGYEIEQALNNVGKDIEFVVYDGEQHEFGVQWGSFMNGSAKFFNQHLR